MIRATVFLPNWFVGLFFIDVSFGFSVGGKKRSCSFSPIRSATADIRSATADTRSVTTELSSSSTSSGSSTSIKRLRTDPRVDNPVVIVDATTQIVNDIAGSIVSQRSHRGIIEKVPVGQYEIPKSIISSDETSTTTSPVCVSYLRQQIAASLGLLKDGSVAVVAPQYDIHLRGDDLSGELAPKNGRRYGISPDRVILYAGTRTLSDKDPLPVPKVGIEIHTTDPSDVHRSDPSEGPLDVRSSSECPSDVRDSMSTVPKASTSTAPTIAVEVGFLSFEEAFQKLNQQTPTSRHPDGISPAPRPTDNLPRFMANFQNQFPNSFKNLFPQATGVNDIPELIKPDGSDRIDVRQSPLSSPTQEKPLISHSQFQSKLHRLIRDSIENTAGTSILSKSYHDVSGGVAFQNHFSDCQGTVQDMCKITSVNPFRTVESVYNFLRDLQQTTQAMAFTVDPMMIFNDSRGVNGLFPGQTNGQSSKRNDPGDLIPNRLPEFEKILDGEVGRMVGTSTGNERFQTVNVDEAFSNREFTDRKIIPELIYDDSYSKDLTRIRKKNIHKKDYKSDDVVNTVERAIFRLMEITPEGTEKPKNRILVRMPVGSFPFPVYEFTVEDKVMSSAYDITVENKDENKDDLEYEQTQQSLLFPKNVLLEIEFLYLDSNLQYIQIYIKGHPSLIYLRQPKM